MIEFFAPNFFKTPKTRPMKPLKNHQAIFLALLLLTVTIHLASGQDLYRRRFELAPLLARHGIRLDVAVLRDHRRSLLSREAGEPLGAAQRALENALNDLEYWLQDNTTA